MGAVILLANANTEAHLRWRERLILLGKILGQVKI